MKTNNSCGPARLVGRMFVALFCAGTAGYSGAALAVPSFAQQTGAPCQQCHTTAYGPALTEYGRQFKLNGYVFGDSKQLMPMAVMVQGGYTHPSAVQPTPPAPQFGVNGQTSVDQVSLFIATRLTEHLGLFSQITYDGIGHGTAWDNTDLRYARSFNVGSSALVAGVSVNNNPTVHDLWNSTPAWGFPFISSALAPSPAAGPIIGGLGGPVDPPSGVSNALQFFSVDLSYSYNLPWVAAVNEFPTTGGSNAALYDPNTTPHGNGYRLQLEYVPFGKLDSPNRPWLNLRFGLQYTDYSKFDGASTNYDGSGRNASDHNTLLAFFWVII